MNLLDRALSYVGLERRGRVDDPNLWLANLVTNISKAGINVTPESAMGAATVFACINILSEAIASLPLIFYRRLTDGSKEPNVNHRLYDLLHSQPNRYQTSFQFRRMMMTHILSRGNCYSYIVTTEDGGIEEIYPLNPQRMDVERLDNGDIVYEYSDDKGKHYTIPSKYIWHITDMVTDGLKGLSRITLARESIGLALASEQYGGQFFGNSAVASSVIRHPSSLQPNARKNLKESLMEFQNAKRFTTMVLEEGMSMEKIGLSNEDAQFLQTRTFQVKEIARWFNVPLVMLGEADKSATFASAEQFFLSFAMHTVLPWCVNWEQSISKDLLTERERKKFFAEFKMDGLMRGDLTSRYSAFKVGREWGWLSANDVRRIENMNPIGPEGDEYLRPLNMTLAGTPVVDPTEVIDKMNGNNNDEEGGDDEGGNKTPKKQGDDEDED